MQSIDITHEIHAYTNKQDRDPNSAGMAKQA